MSRKTPFKYPPALITTTERPTSALVSTCAFAEGSNMRNPSLSPALNENVAARESPRLSSMGTPIGVGK